jgi:hypothetical protein
LSFILTDGRTPKKGSKRQIFKSIRGWFRRRSGNKGGDGDDDPAFAEGFGPMRGSASDDRHLGSIDWSGEAARRVSSPNR